MRTNVTRRLSRPLTLVAVGAAAAALVAGCSSGGGTANSPSASSQPTASATASTTPSPTPSPTPPNVSPLSGLPGGLGKPVLVVKVDNAPEARPHTGLQAADLVYMEEVEGGLSRIAAVYNSTIPNMVGPVRSARISDIDLFHQFGQVLFAYSGAQTKLYPILHDPAKSTLIDAGDNYAPNAYFRYGSRPAPHNYYVNPRKAVAARLSANWTPAHDMGWVFQSAVPAGGYATTSVHAWWPSATFTARWNSAQQKWGINLDGAPEIDLTTNRQIMASTVVIQYVHQWGSAFKDILGNITPYLNTVGTGNAIILRDGKRWAATWSRPDKASSTQYLVNGTEFPFKAGHMWIILVNRDRPVTALPAAPKPKPTASTSSSASPKAG